MKRLFFSAFLSFLAMSAFAQLKQDENKQFTYTEVITFEGKTEKQLFDAVKEWGSTNIANFQRKNKEKNDVFYTAATTEKDVRTANEKPLQLSEPESGKNVIRVITKYNGTQLGVLRRMYLNYDLKVIVKEGKMKFEASNFTYEHYNPGTGQPSPLWGFSDKGDCASRGTLETLVECKASRRDFEKMAEWLNEDIAAMKADLIKKVNSAKNERDF